MRLWSIHPQYLDAQGLVALWREALLAQAVLRNETRGYRNHPQLDRFKDAPSPLAAIAAYLLPIYAESQLRGYTFDNTKIRPERPANTLTITQGQLDYEWRHLLAKLQQRSPAVYEKWCHCPAAIIEAHPLFQIQAGSLEPWERP